DEFTILLDDLGSTREAVEVAQRVQGALSEPFRIAERDLSITASVGISHNEPGIQPLELLRNADIAMYDAKRQGMARSEVFNIDMHGRVVSHLSVETELRSAIEEERLRVFYQPIVDLGSGRLSGFEALARWPADKPPIPPDEFIPVAEDSGLIRPLGRLVLNKACAQLSEWRDRGLVDAGVTISVNVSGSQLGGPHLISDVTSALQRSRLPAQALRLELTESTIMHDPERMPAAIHELERIGVGAYIDDFGTGYSSLTFLHHFPGDTLKIDRSFIGTMHEDASSEEIVRAIIALAHSLNLHAIAEGVDDRRQLKLLHALGCEYAQGYLFGRPQEPGAIEALIAGWDSHNMAIRVLVVLCRSPAAPPEPPEPQGS
ncbi:MAG TPA: GGDEF domain-containing phosphodiesterase, partial [Solirubrobacteraceae bacterium]|nr:GGDEF domain-containing phosphodiesterase [Solirubrobacteraceae bacterium]